uniref:HTH psq-type domain-containing protein n=1 Tax=Plectus sambesii TaxID=2011161 RepID=A0A914UQQ8_9BILA
MVCDGNDCSAMEETKKEVTELRENLTYLTHQIYRIVLALHVPLCQCAVCAAKHQIQNDLIIQSTNIINGTNGDQSDCSAHSSNGVEVPNGVNGSHPITPDVAPFAAEGASEQSPSNATPQLNNVDCQALLSQLFAPVSNGSLMMSTPLSAGSSPLYSGRGRPPLGVTVSPRTQPRTGQPPGRKSKYCTAGEKKAVAIYAAQHGASAAARKFNIPPAVAAYYHRKEYKRGLPKGRR